MYLINYDPLKSGQALPQSRSDQYCLQCFRRGNQDIGWMQRLLPPGALRRIAVPDLHTKIEFLRPSIKPVKHVSVKSAQRRDVDGSCHVDFLLRSDHMENREHCSPRFSRSGRCDHQDVFTSQDRRNRLLLNRCFRIQPQACRCMLDFIGKQTK